MGRTKSWATGKQTRKGVRNEKYYYETYPTFEEIKNDTKLKTPRCQANLDQNKINEMVIEYKKDKYKFRLKDTIIIGVINNTPFLIDGQHRIEMAKRLLEDKTLNDKDIELETFRFCYNIVNNNSQLRELFNSVNKDSKKNEWWINLDNDIQGKIDKFKALLLEKFKGVFPRKEAKYRYTLNEFCIKLQKHKLFKKYSSNEILNQIINKNNSVYNSYYKRDFERNKSTYYTEDTKLINQKIIFVLKNNNFIEHWQLNEPFIHNKKLVKKSIPKIKRDKCWDINCQKLTIQCPIPACSNILYKCDNKSWQAGHIIAERNGGSNDISNLRPICPSCNLSMGSHNWNDYTTQL